MYNFFFLTALFISAVFTSPASISFIDEQNKIITAYNNLNSSDRLYHFGRYICNNFKDHFNHFKPLLDLDSVLFFKGMSEATDKIFLFTVWNTFNSNSLFLCGNQYIKKTPKKFKDFIACFHPYHKEDCATDILYHFKVYLMQALATYEGNKTEMLFKAEDFYILRLKGLILEVLDGLTGYEICKQIEEMYENFRFYHQCTEMKDLMPMFSREFQMLKRAIKNNKKNLIKMHSENIIFLAGILKHDRSTIYGLQLIADQSPQFVRFFLLVQDEIHFLKDPFKVTNNKLDIYRNPLFRYLFDRIPVFKFNACRNMSLRKFKPLEEFKNDYKDILSSEKLLELARTLYKKISSRK
jgi:hypothetical protein